jgi:sec-independent protein translocase protein TatB
MNLVPQFGFLELILVAIVALIVVGPRDLPKLMRRAGQFVAKAKAMAGEFTSAFDQMARESEMEELRNEINELKKNNPLADVKRAVDETIAPIDQELKRETGKINKALNDPKAEDESANS